MRVSIVIPTLNSARTLGSCLASIRAQDFPGAEYEIVVADAGSVDETLAIAAKFGVERVVTNLLRTGEAGKAAGIEAARGEVIALVDSDNVLDGTDWLEKMTAPFADSDVVAAEPLRYVWRADDPALTRYFALLGMSDPLCLFIGNYDRYSEVTGKWTEIPVSEESRDGYTAIRVTGEQVPTFGANGFVVRRRALDGIRWAPYYMDIDVAYQLVRNGGVIAKVPVGIVHLYCDRLAAFARKQDRRIRDFLHFSEQKERSYPWDGARRRGVLMFILSTVTVLPLLYQTLRGVCRKPDVAWVYHIPAMWITLAVYGVATIRARLGIKGAMKSRKAWKQ
jgi:glycosyltransferase involved in cell wall biosynthesis